MMNETAKWYGIGLAALIISDFAIAESQRFPVQAKALIKNSQGQQVGQALIEQEDSIVKLKINLEKIDPGYHGIHLHEKGECKGPSFESAGKHLVFSDKTRHGFKNPQGPHAGDLPQIEIKADGSGNLTYTTPRISLHGSKSIFDGDGTSIVVHDGADDQLTDPAGNSGSRIACGIFAVTK